MFSKVIYSSFSSSFWLEMAKILAVENDWQPVYWLATSDWRDKIQSTFPDAIFHSTLDAVKGIRSPAYQNQKLKAIDVDSVRETAFCQLVTLKMMDRIDVLGSFDYHARVRLYNHQLMYWSTVLDILEPDVVVFSKIPHMVFDYVLYELCRLFNIQTFMFESTPMRGLVFVMDSFDRDSCADELYNDLLSSRDSIDITLSSKTQAYLQTLRGEYEELPAYTRRAYKEELPKFYKSSSQLGFFQKVFDFSNYPKYIEKQMGIIVSRLKSPRNYLKQKYKKLENSSMSRIQYELFRFRARRRMRCLEAYYHELAQKNDFDKKYIYVALSYQPERTSSPMGSIFVNQFLMVDMLSKTLPTGWKLLVKEHPTQFVASKHFRSQSGRNKTFYDDIANLPNVSLVPMMVNSFDLIDHAQAVATVTGTVGWEAVHRGKPALLFGYPWYRGCEGTFHIDTLDSCVRAIRKIKGGYKISGEKLKLFVYALEQTGIEAYVEAHLKVADVSESENAARLATGLQRLIKDESICE